MTASSISGGAWKPRAGARPKAGSPTPSAGCGGWGRSRRWSTWVFFTPTGEWPFDDAARRAALLTIRPPKSGAAPLEANLTFSPAAACFGLLELCAPAELDCRLEKVMLLRLAIAATIASCRVTTATVRADAQSSSARTITLVVVPFPAGGPTDTIGRIIAEGLQSSLGQPVIIENAPGANRQRPDRQGCVRGGRRAHADPGNDRHACVQRRGLLRFCWNWAVAGAAPTIVANDANKPTQTVLIVLMIWVPVSCPLRAGSQCPVQVVP